MRNAVAPRPVRSPTQAPGAGIGLRLPHLAEVATDAPPVSWLEIHPENFLANPHSRELLAQIAMNYPISLHTVGISIGSADGIDRIHLRRLKVLADDLDPFLVSGHLAWSSVGGRYLNDLLPIPYDAASLQLVASHLDEVQQVLGRAYLVENPASYVGFGHSTMSEIEFLSELVDRTACKLLCDISNLYISGVNMGFDPYDYVDAFPADAVAALHLGGFTAEADAGHGGEILIDTHDNAISDAVWSLYEHALGKFGPKPTLIEWDQALPDLSTLLSEAEHADRIAGRIDEERELHAVAG
ncbi:MAG TPA: DUF692 domain-containing protein [Gammaproteobacteria bacterium]|nr:DUF692 domain-containing protein [Gammaproteobacteria bacterium]